MATRMQQRRGTAQQWLDADPVLAAGEIGFETDTNEFRIGDGVNIWSALSPFKNLEDLGGSLDDYVLISTKGQANGVASLDSTGNVPASQLQNVLDGAPAALDTLNEISAALGDDSNYASTILNALDAKAGVTYVNLHKDATTGVHGIADTATLATRTYVGTEIGTHNSDTTSVHGIEDTSLLATTADVSTALDSALSAVSSHESDTTSIHGISNTANLVYTSDLSTHDSNTVSVHGISDTANLVYTADLLAHNLDTTLIHGISDTANLVYTADLSTHTDATTNVHGIANTADLATKSYADGAVSTHSSDTTSVHGIADTSVLATSTTVANAKSEAIAAAGTAADTKVSDAVAALTKSSVGLGNVDNTSDANKPVSTATQTALDLKAPLSAPTFTGTVTSTNDVVVNGNLTVNGTTFNASSTSITIEDNMVQLAHQNAANTVDLGLVVAYNDGSAKHAGLVRDVSDAKWKLFKGVTTEPSPTVDFTQGSLDDLKVAALEATTVTASSGIVFSDGTQVKVGVPSITTFATAISSSATLSAGEQDKFVPLTGAVTITLPATGYSTGQSIDFYQASGTGAQFASTNSVVGTPGLKFRTTNSVVTAMKTSSGWLVFGDLSA